MLRCWAGQQRMAFRPFRCPLLLISIVSVPSGRVSGSGVQGSPRQRPEPARYVRSTKYNFIHDSPGHLPRWVGPPPRLTAQLPGPGISKSLRQTRFRKSKRGNHIAGNWIARPQVGLLCPERGLTLYGVECPPILFRIYLAPQHSFAVVVSHGGRKEETAVEALACTP